MLGLSVPLEPFEICVSITGSGVERSDDQIMAIPYDRCRLGLLCRVWWDVPAATADDAR